MLLLHAVAEFRFRLLSGDLLGTILWRELDTAKAVTHDQATMPFNYQIQVRVHGLNRITKKLCMIIQIIMASPDGTFSPIKFKTGWIKEHFGA